MANIYDVDPSEPIELAAEELKKIEHLKPPEWASYVKTGMHKERPPVDEDWWYFRAASILRKAYRVGPIGVSKLRKHYGGKANRGHKKHHFYKASGNIIRKVLQQLEKAELLKKDVKSLRRGRLISPKGKSLLDKIATKIVKGRPVKKEEPKVEEKKPEVKKAAPKKPSSENEKGSEKPKVPQKLSSENEKGLEKTKSSQRPEVKKESQPQAKPVEKEAKKAEEKQ